MGLVSSNALSSAQIIAEHKKEIELILNTPDFRFGRLNGTWKFKCAGSVMNSNERFFTITDKDVEVIKQKILDKINGNNKHNKEG